MSEQAQEQENNDTDNDIDLDALQANIDNALNDGDEEITEPDKVIDEVIDEEVDEEAFGH